jgi:hypothetical protein
MQGKVKFLKVENISGNSKKTGNDYDMDFGHFLDLQTFDKFRLLLDKNHLASLSAQAGREGILDLGIDPRTEKPYFIGFKVAA